MLGTRASSLMGEGKMFALLFSIDGGKKWRIKQIDDDREVLKILAERKTLFDDLFLAGLLTNEEKLLHATFYPEPGGIKYKIVKVEAEEY